MGGLQLVISDLNSTDDEVRNEAALVLCSAVQRFESLCLTLTATTGSKKYFLYYYQDVPGVYWGGNSPPSTPRPGMRNCSINYYCCYFWL